MDLNQIAKSLQETDLKYAEVNMYIVDEESGKVTQKTIRIDYQKNGDYQWSIHYTPIS